MVAPTQPDSAVRFQRIIVQDVLSVPMKGTYDADTSYACNLLGTMRKS